MLLSKRKNFVREEYGDVFRYLEILTVRYMYFLNMERENEHKMSNGVIEYLAMLVGFFVGVDKGL